MNAIHQLAPLKQFTSKRKALPPWVDGNYRELFSRRDAIRRRYRRTRDYVLWLEFQSLAKEAEQCTE